MRRFGTTFVALMAFALPVRAVATVFDFSATEKSALSPSPVTFDFALNTSSAMLSPSGPTDFFNVAIFENGTLSSGNTISAQFGTDLGSPLFFLIDTSPSAFFSGSGSGITFNVGNFNIADGATDGEGTLNIAVVSEPASWLFLLCGCGLASFGL